MPVADLPIFDLHFHPHPDWDEAAVVQAMDELGVVRAANGAVAYDHQPQVTDEVALEWAQRHPDLFIPFAGQVAIRKLVLEKGVRAWTLESETVREYMANLDAELSEGKWRGIGELFVKNINTHPYRDFQPTEYPADSAMMVELWRLSAKHRVPLSVHMEADDVSVAQMEHLLKSNREGIWLWAHTGYFAEPDLLRRLFEEHPNFHAELSWRDSVRESRLGTSIDQDGRLKPGWKELFEDYPDRFTLGTDVSIGSLYQYRDVIAYWRGILKQLSPNTAAMLAYRNAEQLLGLSGG